jgi:hypothetical protein
VVSPKQPTDDVENGNYHTSHDRRHLEHREFRSIARREECRVEKRRTAAVLLRRCEQRAEKNSTLSGGLHQPVIRSSPLPAFHHLCGVPAGQTMSSPGLANSISLPST